MRRLLQCRQDELKAVYHEKELVDVLLTMSNVLAVYMTGMVKDLSVLFEQAVAENPNHCLFHFHDS